MKKIKIKITSTVLWLWEVITSIKQLGIGVILFVISFFMIYLNESTTANVAQESYEGLHQVNRVSSKKLTLLMREN